MFSVNAFPPFLPLTVAGRSLSLPLSIARHRFPPLRGRVDRLNHATLSRSSAATEYVALRRARWKQDGIPCHKRSSFINRGGRPACPSNADAFFFSTFRPAVAGLERERGGCLAIMLRAAPSALSRRERAAPRVFHHHGPIPGPRHPAPLVVMTLEALGYNLSPASAGAALLLPLPERVFIMNPRDTRIEFVASAA